MAKKSSSQTAVLFGGSGRQGVGDLLHRGGAEPEPPHVRRSITPRAMIPKRDQYKVTAFNQPITGTKATALYMMHSYHQGKKPHDAIRQYIRHYTQPGDVVLDPFSGSGSTALARPWERRSSIAGDRSPASTFITKNYCSPTDASKLRQAYQKVRAAVQAEMNWLYGTKCDRCNGDATVVYTVYSQVFQCPRCNQKVGRSIARRDRDRPVQESPRRFECVPTVLRNPTQKKSTLAARPSVTYRYCNATPATTGVVRPAPRGDTTTPTPGNFSAS